MPTIVEVLLMLALYTATQLCSPFALACLAANEHQASLDWCEGRPSLVLHHHDLGLEQETETPPADRMWRSISEQPLVSGDHERNGSGDHIIALANAEPASRAATILTGPSAPLSGALVHAMTVAPWPVNHYEALRLSCRCPPLSAIFRTTVLLI